MKRASAADEEEEAKRHAANGADGTNGTKGAVVIESEDTSTQGEKTRQSGAAAVASAPPTTHATAPLHQALVRAAPRNVLVVFDLDSTLWDGNCEHFGACHRIALDRVSDGSGFRTLRIFPEVKLVFDALHDARIPVAIASASPATSTAKRLLQLFGLRYEHAEVFAGAKAKHFDRIRTASGRRHSFREMIFFDDLRHVDVERLGVHTVRVRGGLKASMLLEGFKAMSQAQKASGLMRKFFTPKFKLANAEESVS